MYISIYNEKILPDPPTWHEGIEMRAHAQKQYDDMYAGGYILIY